MDSVIWALSGGHPYFPSSAAAVQGTYFRHPFMAGSVGWLDPNLEVIRILEIGSWVGFSALTWAEAAQEFLISKNPNITVEIFCLDPWELSDAKEYQGDQSDGTLSIMKATAKADLAYKLFCHNVSFVPNRVKVIPIRSYSSHALPILKENSFDIVYIDGSHYYDDVVFDINYAKKLVKPNGYISGDDLEIEFFELTPEEQAATIQDKRKNGSPPVSVHKVLTGHDFHAGVTCAVHETLSRVTNLFGYWVAKKEADGNFAPIRNSPLKAIVPKHFPPYAEHATKRFLAAASPHIQNGLTNPNGPLIFKT